PPGWSRFAPPSPAAASRPPRLAATGELLCRRGFPPWSADDAPYIGGLTQMLGAVVDDADQPRAGGDRRIPPRVDDAAELVRGQRRNVLQRHLLPAVVVAGQQVGRRAHLADIVWAVTVTGVVAREVETEPVDPAVARPHLFGACNVAELQVLDARAMPDQPADAVGGARRTEERGRVGQPVGQLLDMLDEAGERVAQQFPDRLRIRVSHALTLPVGVDIPLQPYDCVAI